MCFEVAHLLHLFYVIPEDFILFTCIFDLSKFGMNYLYYQVAIYFFSFKKTYSICICHVLYNYNV